MKTVPFYIVDVFAEKPNQGNQLAVFTNATGLTAAQMRAMAREINFAESTFVEGGSVTDGFRVRIFTPEYEVPFAGHPTLGTAWLIANRLLPSPPAALTLHVPIGPIPVTITDELVWLETVQPTFGPVFTPDELTDLINLPQRTLVDNPPVQLISTGLPYIILPLVSREALRTIWLEDRAVEHWLRTRNLLREHSADGQTAAFYAFCRNNESANPLSARAFIFENGRVVEDAATGSAASCLLAYLLTHNALTETTLQVEQGDDMGRPSRLYLHGTRAANGRYQLRVGGKVQLVAQGEWTVAD